MNTLKKLPVGEQSIKVILQVRSSKYIDKFCMKNKSIY